MVFSDNAYTFNLHPKDDGSMFITEEASWYRLSKYRYMSKNLDESKIKDSGQKRDSYLRWYLQSYKIYHFHDTSKGSPLRSAAKVNDNRILKEDGGNLPAYLYLMQQKYPKALKRIETVIRRLWTEV